MKTTVGQVGMEHKNRRRMDRDGVQKPPLGRWAMVYKNRREMGA